MVRETLTPLVHVKYPDTQEGPDGARLSSMTPTFRHIARRRPAGQTTAGLLGVAMRLRFETIFLVIVWIAVILLLILYPRSIAF